MRRRRNQDETLPKALNTLLTKTLLPDLQARARTPAVEAALCRRWEHEKAERRTAESFTDWIDQTVEQVGAAWILSCVFVRTLEDRDLLGRRRLAGEGAADSEQYFYEIAPSLTARDYLLTVFREVSRLPGAENLLGPRHNPAWRLSPSGHAAQELLEFFRRKTDGGSLQWTFGGSDTRFLGDLYQDLSEDAKKRYALLQTPDFVERFILDLTLEPAVQEFGLEEVRVIDPTCGSGHFLLGAYDRLFEKRLAAKPGLDRREHAHEALKQVYGTDLNPYAVAIAKFRLTLSYLQKAGIETLREAPRLPLNLVVADSLLYGARGVNRDFVEFAESKKGWDDELFTLEEPEMALAVLGKGYHVVVGNPPYITCKDAALRERYRELYPRSAAGTYALAAPFTERFFQLAVQAGYVGLINANSFMKREFGKKLVEEVLSKLDLTRVIDTSGIPISGHGTSTVILIGRSRPPMGEKVSAVLGKRGEPETPADPAKGNVWSSIARHFGEVGFENDFISVSEIHRETLARHPWSLGGGGAAELKQLLETRAEKRLRALVKEIGRSTHTGEDSVFFMSQTAARRLGIGPDSYVPLVTGEQVRDWAIVEDEVTLFPYDKTTAGVRQLEGREAQYYWMHRTTLRARSDYGQNIENRVVSGRRLSWYEHSMFFPDRYLSPLSIAFPFVATHNHFVLDRGGKVFNRTAPVIKLPTDATEEDHFASLGYLNSSTACFWMKQVCFDKGTGGIGGGISAEHWERRYEYDATKLQAIPLPRVGTERIAQWAKLLDSAGKLYGLIASPSALEDIADGREVGPKLERIAAQVGELEAKVRWLQEELDWEVYRAFGLASVVESNMPEALDQVPDRQKGSRPSDRRYALEVLNGNATRRYFELCHLPSPEEIVALPLGEVDRKRLELIASSQELQLIEVPAYKRTYREGHRPWSALPALRGWILSRIEAILRESPADRGPMAVREVAAKIRDIVGDELLGLGGLEDAPALINWVLDGAVPTAATQRFTESGLQKHALWERVWELQRAEDRGENECEVPTPPKYAAEDYRDLAYWRLRGKLDVPKERFISYPGAERDDDRSPLVGWAGWDHLQRSRALAALYMERKTQDGWEKARLMPLLAGLFELVPWLKQWHNEPSDDPEKDRAGDAYEKFVQEEARALGVTLDDLRAWRPENGKKRARKALARGRRKPPGEGAAG